MSVKFGENKTINERSEKKIEAVKALREFLSLSHAGFTYGVSYEIVEWLERGLLKTPDGFFEIFGDNTTADKALGDALKAQK